MAIAKVADRTTFNSATASTTADLVLTGLTVGNRLIIRCAADNAGGGGAATSLAVTNQSGTPIDLATDVTYTANADPGAASAGSTCFVVTAAITATSGTVRLTFGTSIIKSIVVEEFSGIHAITPVVGTPVTGTGTTTALASTADTSVAVGNMAYGATSIEGPAGDTYTNDSDTTNGSWVALTKVGTTNATADLNQTITGAYKIVTATGAQTHNPTNSVARDSAGLIIEFAADPSITQAAYGFFDDVGTESGATALVAQDTAVTGNLSLGDGPGVVRLRLQSTSAVAVDATEDFQLQWEKNASGSWTNVGTGAVLGYNAPSLTEGAVTTNRLTGGTGSFVAGKVSEDGLADNVGWSGNNYTELVYSVMLIAAQLADGDTLRFRVVRAGGITAGMTYTATPTVNIAIIPPVSKDLSAVWHTRETVGDTLEAIWNVEVGGATTPVGKDLSVQWDTRAPVGDTINPQWSVRTAVGDQADLRWAVRTSVGDQADLRWAVRTRVGDQVDVRWGTRTGLGDSLNVQWAVRTKVGDQADLRWAVRTRVGDQADLRWAVRALAGDQVALVWGTRAAAGKALDVRWGVRTTVGDQVAAVWNVEGVGGVVGVSLDIRWAIRQKIGDQSDLRWAVRTRVGDQADLRWAVRTKAGDQIDLRWRTAQVVGDSIILRWNTRTSVADTLQAIWGVRTKVGDQADLRWAVRAALGDTLTLRWDVLSGTSIGKSLSAQWSVRAPVGKSLTASWNVEGKSSKDAQMYLYENIGLAPSLPVSEGSMTFYENIGLVIGAESKEGQQYIYEYVVAQNQDDRAGAIVVRRRSF